MLQTRLTRNCVKGLSSPRELQLEVNDHLNHGSGREVHAYDSQALVQVCLGLKVLVQLCVDALSDGSGVREHASSAAVGEKDLGHVSCRCSLQVFIHTLPLLLHMQKCGNLQRPTNCQLNKLLN